MTCHKITTQAELDAGYQAAPGDCFHVRAGTFEAWGSAHVEEWESAHVVARESAHVEAWGSAHVEARESAHVVARESAHVEAWGSAHVVAWGSAHVEAWGSAHVVARESAHVEASAYVAVHQHGTRTTVTRRRSSPRLRRGSTAGVALAAVLAWALTLYLLDPQP